MTERSDEDLWAEAELAAARLDQVKPDVARRATTPVPSAAAAAAAAGSATPRSGRGTATPVRADVGTLANRQPEAFVALTGRFRSGGYPAELDLPEPASGSWGTRLLSVLLVVAVGAGTVAFSAFPVLRNMAAAVVAPLTVLSDRQPPPPTAAVPHDLPPVTAVPLAPPDDEVVTVVAVGDIMLARAIAPRLGQPGNVLYPFAAVAPLLRAADLTVGNLESPVAGGGKPRAGKPYVFRAPPQAASTLAAAGFGAVSLANNHTGDYGADGLRETLQHLRRAGVQSFGAGLTRTEAQGPLNWTSRGTRIAFVGFNDVELPGLSATDQDPGIFAATEKDLVDAVARARREADFVVVMPHWGPEYQPLPDARQRQLARLLTEAGADLILGAHPHVRQSVEIMAGKPVVYSLGNFAFDGMQNQPGGATEGALVRFRVHKGQLLGLEQIVVRISPDGVPQPAPDLPQGRTWMEIVGNLALRWRGDPAADRNDLVSLDRLLQPSTCPVGRYRVLSVAVEGIELENEQYVGSRYWLTAAGDPIGCAGLPPVLLQSLAWELVPGSQVVVPAGGL